MPYIGKNEQDMIKIMTKIKLIIYVRGLFIKKGTTIRICIELPLKLPP